MKIIIDFNNAVWNINPFLLRKRHKRIVDELIWKLSMPYTTRKVSSTSWLYGRNGNSLPNDRLFAEIMARSWHTISIRRRDWIRCSCETWNTSRWVKFVCINDKSRPFLFYTWACPNVCKGENMNFHCIHVYSYFKSYFVICLSFPWRELFRN